MKSEIRHKPGFSTVFLDLEPGETVVAEADAMASMDTTISMKTRLNGGFFGGLMRKVGGSESMFVNEFTADAAGQIVLTQGFPGDMIEYDMSEGMIYLQPGAYVASTPEVKMGLGWAGFSSWFGKEGLFRLKITGTSGKVWFGAYGGIYEREVDGDYVVDTGHLVGYTPGLELKIGRAGGLMSSFFSGEGFVSRIKGKGKLWLQSRSLDGLKSWTNAHI